MQSSDGCCFSCSLYSSVPLCLLRFITNFETSYFGYANEMAQLHGRYLRNPTKRLKDYSFRTNCQGDRQEVFFSVKGEGQIKDDCT